MADTISAPQVLSDDGKTVIVRTAQGDDVPLSRDNPAHVEMINAFEAHGHTPHPDVNPGVTDPGAAMFNTMPEATAPGVTPAMAAPQAPVAAPDAATSAQSAQPAPVPATPAAAAPVAAPPMSMKMESKTAQASDVKSLSPEAKSQLNAAKNAQKEATAAEFDAQPTAQDAAAKATYAASLQAIEDRQRAREAQQRAYSDQMQQKMSDAADKLSNMKVDSNFFGRLDTGDKIMAGASILLGALGAGFSGSNNNVGMDVIQKAIDRDIDAQKANISNYKAGFEAQKGGYAEFLKATGDERLATISETERQLGLLKSTLMNNAGANANQMTAAAKKAALAQIDAKYADLTAEKTGIVNKNAVDSSTDVGQSKLPEAPKDEADAIAAKERAIADLRTLRDASKEAEGKNVIGPQARLAAIARTLGMDAGTDASVIQSRLTQYTAQRLHDLTGRVTPAETEIMAPSFANVHDNPKTFNALLDQEISNAERELKQRRQQWAGHSGLPNQTIQTTPDTGAQKSQYGFKKQ